MKKIKYYILLIPISLTLNAAPVSLLMVPNNSDAVKVGLDIASHQPSTLLIKYQLGAQNTARLYGWKGTEWVSISNSSFYNGGFFKEPPQKTIIIEAQYTFPQALIPNEDWCKNIYKISNAPISSLIHLIGINLNFNNNDWRSFSNLYGIPLNKINPNNVGVQWYHRRLTDVLKSSDGVNKSDEVYWEIIREEPSLSLVEYIKDEVELNTDLNLNDEEIIQETIIIDNPLIEEPPAAIINY